MNLNKKIAQFIYIDVFVVDVLLVTISFWYCSYVIVDAQ